MLVNKNGAIIFEDRWISVHDDGAIPLATPVIVSLRRWQAERHSLVARHIPVGVRLASHEHAESIATDLGLLDLVAIEFPSIGDGRGYSNGRLLRERHAFGGELRAVGSLVRDVFPMLYRCGFDVIEARDEVEALAWHDAIEAIAVAYQPTIDDGSRYPFHRDNRASAAT